MWNYLVIEFKIVLLTSVFFLIGFHLVFLFNQFCFKLVLIRICFDSGLTGSGERQMKKGMRWRGIRSMVPLLPAQCHSLNQLWTCVKWCTEQVCSVSWLWVVSLALCLNFGNNLPSPGHGRPFPLGLQTIPGAVAEGDSAEWKLF